VSSIWEALSKIVWDLVVIDESHKIKNSRTNRYKSVIKIDDMRARAKMILTGTPITNVVFDLWSQWEWLGRGLSGFSTYENFRAFHGRWEADKRGSGVQKLVGFKNTPLIQERLARLAFLILKKDANLNLPDKVYDLYEVNMDPVQAGLYKKMATKLVIEIDDIIAVAEAEGKQVTVDHILTKLIRLAQICSGFVKTDDAVDLELSTTTKGGIFQISEKNPKIEALLSILREDWENDPNSKIIVWATFIEDIRAISQKLADESIKHVGYHSAVHPDYRVSDSVKAEDMINKDESCKVLLANPASAGIGQNFLGYDVSKPDECDTYVNHEIYFSCNWSAVDRIQSEDRAHRRGTRTNVRITDLMIPGTIDQEIRMRVNDKRMVAMTIQDIKNILNNLVQGYQ
jgi:SNF2 family DNA or RNA helicase